MHVDDPLEQDRVLRDIPNAAADERHPERLPGDLPTQFVLGLVGVHADVAHLAVDACGLERRPAAVDLGGRLLDRCKIRRQIVRWRGVSADVDGRHALIERRLHLRVQRKMTRLLLMRQR
ncbi:hypothetical protein [Streptomyces canus]|uniref:hypothetical protein n=1 Tax=Streptomyces canus TaxID=58343 RepID=UPI002DDB7452|nr:hypothetical protein [Streptomyces canus]WSD91023.1 hypothetical protein OG925_44975 [Streptomyces canus]